MESRDIFRNISPLDHRYALSDRSLFEELSRYFSEHAAVKYFVEVECALVRAHLDEQKADATLAQSLHGLSDRIPAAEVYTEEEKTRHNIRALVNVMKRYVPDALKPLVHLGATSVDILDTSQALRVRDGIRSLVLPRLIALQNLLCNLAQEHASTAQVGRTHGQFAVPVTLGFMFAEYVSRLGKSIIAIETHVADLRGKIAGAVGAYNATSMLYADPIGFEARVLGYIGLKPSDHSTQMVEPEYLLRVLTEINTAFGVIANLADDLRHLQRSEIDEVREYFSPDQVGSSTMPQKRNPWNAEHVKSLWKAFAPRVITFYMDQISEHQRDLSNSASGRFVMDYLAGFVHAVVRMTKILEGLTVNKDQLAANLDKGGAGVLAEPAYIILSQQGEADAHETIRRLTLAADQQKVPFLTVLKADQGVWAKLSKGLAELGQMPPEQFFAAPANYCGKAPEKAKGLAAYWLEEMSALKNRLETIPKK
jgi:adenylosuccinate lyase